MWFQTEEGSGLKTLFATGLDREEAHGYKGGKDERPRGVDRSIGVQASSFCSYNGRAETCDAVQTGCDTCACPSIWSGEDFRGADVYILAWKSREIPIPLSSIEAKRGGVKGRKRTRHTKHHTWCSGRKPRGCSLLLDMLSSRILWRGKGRFPLVELQKPWCLCGRCIYSQP